MSRIDQLIGELAPMGVQFKALGDVAQIASARADVSLLDATTYVGVDNLLPNFGGRRDSDYGANSSGAIRFRPGDVLVGNIRPYLKKVWLADREGAASPDVLTISLLAAARESVLPRFLYFLIASESFIAYSMQHAKGAKMPRGDKAATLKYRIPVPPLDVQREIVRILDHFTELAVALELELQARCRQYDFYRDQLMSFPEPAGVKRAPMGEVVAVVRGASPRPIQAFLTDSEDGVPWIKIGDVPAGGKYITSTAQRITKDGALKSRMIHPGDFVLSNSMSFGRPYISNIEGAIHDGWLAISDFRHSFSTDFLYHLLRSAPIQAEFSRRAGSSTVSNLNADIVRAVPVPVPSLDEQARIVELLDRFDNLVNDPTVGIPAEIGARRQQYEYYREKLLTFDEAAA